MERLMPLQTLEERSASSIVGVCEKNGPLK